MGRLNAAEYSHILDNSVLTLWQQFKEGPFLFKPNIAPVHKAESIKKWFSKFDVDELKCPAHPTPEMNFNPISEPGLISQRQFLTSPVQLRLNRMDCNSNRQMVLDWDVQKSYF